LAIAAAAALPVVAAAALTIVAAAALSADVVPAREGEKSWSRERRSHSGESHEPKDSGLHAGKRRL
jgi:hypothetical protein